MNKKDLKALEAVAGDKGLKVDSRSGILFGNYKGYMMAVCPGAQRGQFTLVTSVSVGGQPLDQKDIKSKIKQYKKSLAGVSVQRYLITFTLRPSVWTINKMFKTIIPSALDDVASILSEYGCTNCCQDSGATSELDLYMCNGIAAVLSSSAYAARSSSAAREEQSAFLKKENLVGGVVGAFLGSLIGAASIVLVGQLGYVAAICGFIMAICTLKGYEMLGGKLSKKGAVIGIVIMLAMVYLSNRADWALSISRQLATAGYDFFTCFQAISYWLEIGAIESTAYYGNLVMLYLFAILGGFSTIKSALTTSTAALGVYRLGSDAGSSYSSSASGDMM